jgi:hypothetical protein
MLQMHAKLCKGSQHIEENSEDNEAINKDNNEDNRDINNVFEDEANSNDGEYYKTSMDALGGSQAPNSGFGDGIGEDNKDDGDGGGDEDNEDNERDKDYDEDEDDEDYKDNEDYERDKDYEDEEDEEDEDSSENGKIDITSEQHLILRRACSNFTKALQWLLMWIQDQLSIHQTRTWMLMILNMLRRKGELSVRVKMVRS